MLSSLRVSSRLLKPGRFPATGPRGISSNHSEPVTLQSETQFKPFNSAIGKLEGCNKDNCGNKDNSQNDGPLYETVLRRPADCGKHVAESETPTQPSNRERRTVFIGTLKQWEKARAAPGSRLLHRQILITGGSSGIGYAIAKRCVEEGATSVAILSRSDTRASQAIARIKRETGLSDAPIWAVIGDLADHEMLVEDLGREGPTRWVSFQHLQEPPHHASVLL